MKINILVYVETDLYRDLIKSMHANIVVDGRSRRFRIINEYIETTAFGDVSRLHLEEVP